MALLVIALLKVLTVCNAIAVLYTCCCYQQGT
jgi:hypothetical protein